MRMQSWWFWPCASTQTKDERAIKSRREGGRERKRKKNSLSVICSWPIHSLRACKSKQTNKRRFIIIIGSVQMFPKNQINNAIKTNSDCGELAVQICTADSGAILFRKRAEIMLIEKHRLTPTFSLSPPPLQPALISPSPLKFLSRLTLNLSALRPPPTHTLLLPSSCDISNQLGLNQMSISFRTLHRPFH